MYFQKPRSPMSRRTVLRGTGVCLSLPFLESMLPGSVWGAAPSLPFRLAVFTVPFGMVDRGIHPTESGENYSLSKTLEPLSNLRQDFTLFSNLHHGVRGGHAACHTMLSGIRLTERSAYSDGNITLDQRAAELFGHETRFRSLLFWKEGMSFTRAGVRVPAVEQPSRAFELLFVDENLSTKKSLEKGLETRGSILDAVQNSAHRLQEQLGTEDRRKLDEYFTSVRETEKKVATAQKWLNQPKAKVDLNARNMKKVAEGEYDKVLAGSLVEVWFDLMFLALQTDSTRVVMTSTDNCTWGLEGVTETYHTLSHHGQRDDMLGQLAIIEGHLMHCLAGFIDRLKSTPQAGGGSLLSSTQVLFGSGMGEGNSHSNDNLPLILAGGGFRHGQHIDCKNELPLNNLYLKMLQGMGYDLKSFNTSTNRPGVLGTMDRA